jgi:hypothetical protein
MEVGVLRKLQMELEKQIEIINHTLDEGISEDEWMRGVRDGYRMVSLDIKDKLRNLEASHEQNSQGSKDQAAEESRRLQDAQARDAQVHQREEGSQPIGVPRGYSGGFLI